MQRALSAWVEIGRLSAIAAMIVWMTGCASSGYKKGDKAAANIRKAADRIEALPGEIDRALVSLNDLVNNSQSDLRPQFKKFSSNLKTVVASADHIAAARRAMGEKGKAFFDKWDEQLASINNEDIKARSQSRKDEVARKLTAIKVSYEEAAQAFRPFIADLRDVHRFLEVDLTADGVAAVRDTLAEAVKDSGRVKESVTQLARDFQALGLAMSSVTPSTQE